MTTSQVAPVAGTLNAAPTVTALIPAKNEAANIGWVLDRMPPSVHEVIVVDGCSTDGTRAVARSRRPDVVIVREDQPGKGTAIRAGLAAATGDIVVMLDADGSMDPAEIDAFIESIESGNDLAKGSRFLPGAGTADISALRDFGNGVLTRIANVLFRTSRTDLCYGYAGFRREPIQRLGLTATGFEIEAQLFLRAEGAGLRVAEVPSFEAPRRFGASNLNTFRDGSRVLFTILAEWWRAQGMRSSHGRVRRAGDAPATPVPASDVPVGLTSVAPFPVAPPEGQSASWASEPGRRDESVLAWGHDSLQPEQRVATAPAAHRSRARARRAMSEPVESPELSR